MNKTLNIGIDIDNTITKLYEHEIIRGREFCEEFGLPTNNFNPLGSNVKEMYSIPDDLYQIYMDRYFCDNVRNRPPRDFAVEVINRLSLNNIIHIVTARDANYPIYAKYSGEEMVKDTNEYFNKYQIPHHLIHFSSQDKCKVCKENNINLIIEDDPKHIEECANGGIVVIVISLPYNQIMRQVSNTIFVDSWLEIPHIIDSIEHLL